MKTRSSAIGVLSIATMFLAACSREPQPTKSDIEQALTTYLPAFARVSSLSVEAMQNLGTKVEPAWNARFHSTIKVTSDTFATDGMASGVTFVRPIKRDGEATEIFGKSVSRLYAGTWRTSLEFDGQPIPALGMPQSSFAPNKVIVRGSKSETDYVAEQAERRRVAIVTAQRETEERRAAEMRAAEQKRAGEERANEERRRMLEEASKLLIGTWRDENSLYTYAPNGTATFKHDTEPPEKTTWSIDGDTIVRRVIEINGRPVENGRVFRERLLEITKTTMVIKGINTNNEYHATRVK